MRMWMVNPKIMCKQHLIGEHGELHKFLHNWTKQHKIDGRIAGNAIEPLSYKTRHDMIVEEMVARGYNHKSPLEQPNFNYLPKSQQQFKVNTNESLNMLVERCEHCRAKAEGV